MQTLPRSMRVVMVAAVLIMAGFAVAVPAGATEAPSGRHHMHCTENMQQHVDRRLTRLHADLHLTADQATAWQTYEKTIRTQMQTLAKHHKKPHEEHAATAPQRLDRHIAAMQAWLDALKPLAAATHTFYDQLSPTQKTIFDLETRHHGHGDYHHGHHRHQ